MLAALTAVALATTALLAALLALTSGLLILLAGFLLLAALLAWILLALILVLIAHGGSPLRGTIPREANKVTWLWFLDASAGRISE
jgi:hypothetical protein